MNLLDLASEIGLDPRKTSVSRGGEYHSPCPACGGNDRFIIWPAEDRYWCRQCARKGDAIQFCREFHKLPFHQACTKAGKNSSDVKSHRQRLPNPVSIRTPSRTWETQGKIFLANSIQRLLIDKIAIDQLLQRGLTLDSIKKNQIGWNPIQSFHRRADWGLEETEKRKWLCLPAGIVIPLHEGENLRKIKIRKSDWTPTDVYGKYYEVPGSSNTLTLFGAPSINITVIVEAEFDAMLIIQETGSLCNCIALGGASKRPHPLLHKWLLQQKVVLFALDFDEAGKKQYIYWRGAYPDNLKPWPVPEEKSPGDYFVRGGSLKGWIEAGLEI